ncbi:MAG: DNA polymerase I [Phycisphaerales bacterium]
MPAPPTLYLIDGYAQFFRAYHAIRTPMSSPVTKEPTNLTFGFIGMLLKLLRGEGKVGADDGQPDYIAVALDVSGDRGTFRSRLYPEYKANRPPPPEDLPVQVDRCLRTLRELGVPIIGAEGYEADDVIATLVSKLHRTHPDLRIRIISKDKDLKQLLSDRLVELYDIHTDEVTDAAKLQAETGISPAQVVDMLALMGDSSDNVRGADGVGPKTAARLIAEYGSLDNLMVHVGEIKGKRGENLRAAAARLPLSKDLVTLRHDAPVDLELGSASKQRFRLGALLPILKELGFNRYQEDVKALLGEPVGGSAAPLGAALASGSPAKSARVGRSRSKDSLSDPFDSGLFSIEPVPSQAGSAEEPLGARRAQSGEYRCICTKAELDELIGQMRSAPIFAVDTETTSLSPHRAQLCGISVSVRAGTGAYIPIRSPDPTDHLDERTVLETLRPLLEDPARPRCGHNLKYDLLIFRRHGVKLDGFLRPRRSGLLQTPAPGATARAASHVFTGGVPVEPATAFDSMVASYLIDADRSSHSLDALALALLGRTNISLKELLGTGEAQRTFDTVPLDLAAQYAAEDADVSLQLHELMSPQLRDMNLDALFSMVEMPLVEVLAELEWNGITVDPAELDRQRGRLQSRIEDLRGQIADEAYRTIGREFNPDSPKQLSSALFNKPTDPEPGLGLRPVKKLKTGYSTDSEVLEKLAQDPAVSSQIPRLILENRELTKLVGTYLVALKEAIEPSTGRIHSSFNQTVAATGRLASSDPNLQNIPIRTEIGREIRKAFVAAPGCVLISADYSQIELRLLAHLSRDPALIEAFRSGEDIHAAVAAQIHGVPPTQVTREQRSGAKMVNFGIVYGVTPFGLARRLGCSNTQAEEIIRGYKQRFAGISTFLEECIDHARRHGYVQTMLGRRRPINEIDSNVPARRAFAERIAINSVVQGSAADLIKLAMIDIQSRIAQSAAACGLRMLLQIHDELVFECPVGVSGPMRDMVVDRMEHAMRLDVPLRVESSIAENWFDGK